MSRGKAKTTYAAVVLTAAIFLVCCAVPSFIRPTGTNSVGSNAEAVAGSTKVSLVWKASIGELTDLSFAPGGKFLAVVTSGGTVQTYTRAGVECTHVQLPGMDSLVLSPDGKYAMAFSRLNRKNTTCTFIDSQGHICWDLDVNGAVWSADSCDSDDGARFVIGTGGRRVYVVDIGEHGKYYKWWTVPGAVVSLDVDFKGENVVLGTWQSSRVECRSIGGRCIWSAIADPATLPRIEPLSFSDSYCVRYIPNKRSADGTYQIVSAQGRIASSGIIDVSRRTQLLFDRSGKYTCLGYTELIEHKGKSMLEKRTVLQDNSGKQLWEKGSVFFQTEPILVTARGEVLLKDGENALFITTPTGNLEPIFKLPGKLLQTASSSDVSMAAIKCSDGDLYVFKLSQ